MLGEMDCFAETAESKCGPVEKITATGSVDLKGEQEAFEKFLSCATDHSANALAYTMKTCNGATASTTSSTVGAAASVPVSTSTSAAATAASAAIPAEAKTVA